MCTIAPELGNMVANSANTKASSRMAAAPIIHEKTLHGPASTAACSAPNSQPDPMMLPRLAYRSPITPTSRLSFAAPAICHLPLCMPWIYNPEPRVRGAGPSGEYHGEEPRMIRVGLRRMLETENHSNRRSFFWQSTRGAVEWLSCGSEIWNTTPTPTTLCGLPLVATR